MRLFVALPLPEAITAPLARLAASAPVGRAVAEENMHLTLAFLGEVARAELPALDAALSELRHAPFPVAFHELTALGGRQARLLVLTATGPEALHSRLTTALRCAEFTLARRRFRPHVTLLRLPRQMGAHREQKLAQFLAGVGRVELAPCTATGFGLYASHLHPGGAVYETLAEYPLG